MLEYHQILQTVLNGVKADQATMHLTQDLLRDERTARTAEATLRRDQGLELERLRSVATTAQARETEIEGILKSLREEMAQRAQEEVHVR